MLVIYNNFKNRLIKFLKVNKIIKTKFEYLVFVDIYKQLPIFDNIKISQL